MPPQESRRQTQFVGNRMYPLFLVVVIRAATPAPPVEPRVETVDVVGGAL